MPGPGRGSSWSLRVSVLAGEGQEGVLEAAGGDLEVAGVGAGEEVPGDGVGVAGVEEDGVAAELDAVDPGDPLEPEVRGARKRGPDGPTGRSRLHLGGGAV